MEDANDAWMDEDIVCTMEEKEDEQKEEKVVQSEPVETEASTQEKPPESKSSSGYKALPMEDANDAWMDEDIVCTMEEKEDEQKEEKVVQSEPVETEASTQEKPPESKPSSGYKALPMEDANDAWMD